MHEQRDLRIKAVEEGAFQMISKSSHPTGVGG